MNGNISKTTSTVITEAIFSKDREHRYLLAKQWDKTLPVALVVMLYPTDFTDELTIDTTTLLVQNNCVRLKFGGIKLVNLFSSCHTGKDKKSLMQCTDKTNNETILAAAKSADKIIMATGRNTTSKAILKRREEVTQLLSDFKDKMYEIGCGDGTSGYHPLFPKAKKWILVKINSDDKKPDFQPG